MSATHTVRVTPDGREAAASARLIYVSDRSPGIRRRRRGRGFEYVDVRNRVLRDAGELERIHQMAIPPAWRHVWICVHPRGHIQATGRDARERKQYRYHPGWREVRDSTKFAQILAFASGLPALRQRIAQDIAAPGLPKRKVVAAVVALLEKSLIRIGNAEYTRHNRSFGLTTLRSRHVHVMRSRVRFRFKGKGGKFHEISINDARLAPIVRRCRELPGHELFQYLVLHPSRRDRCVRRWRIHGRLAATERRQLDLASEPGENGESRVETAAPASSARHPRPRGMSRDSCLLPPAR